MIIPCDKFKFGKNKKEFETEFKSHYKTCKNCDRTNNNHTDISEFLTTYKINQKEIEDEEEIDKYLDYFYNGKKYDSKTDKIIHVLKINNEDHDYHNSLIILF